MNGSLSDIIGVLIATLLGVPLVVLPGYALGVLSGVLGFRDLAPGRRLLCAALLGIGLLPFLDSALVAVAGVPATTLASLAVAAAVLVPVARTWRGRIDGTACALTALWIGVAIYALIDVDTGDALHQPIGVIDLVKHAALTRSIVESGAPPLDPFFARPERVSYYYFFYTLCALVDWLGGELVDGRTAFAGLAIWTGIALAGLLDRLLAASSLVGGAPARFVRGAVLLLLPAGGLDLMIVLKARFETGAWVPVPEWLNEQVLWWPGSLLWVPHHVAAALAGWLGLLALAEAADGERPGRAAEAGSVAVAAIAFAACVGLSVWVCIGTVAAAGLWLALLLIERRWRDAGRLAAAGLVGVALATPYLLDVLANRDGSGRAVVFDVRAFGPIEGLVDGPAMGLVRLVLLPLNYYLGFGVFAAGALLFWALVPRPEAHRREAGRLLTICAAAGLLIGGFLRSAILYNDLGWRVVLIAQISAFAWSVVALARLAASASRTDTATLRGTLPGPGRLRLPIALAALLLTGYGTALYGLVEARAYPDSGQPEIAFLNARGDIDRALRGAYRWAGAHLPHDLVLQQDPTVRRAFDFGLYGRHQVAVADRDAKLFGAPAAAVASRLERVGPIFGAGLRAPEVRRRAAEAGIGALVVTAQDAVWGEADSWVWRTKAAYAGPLVRIVRVEDLDG